MTVEDALENSGLVLRGLVVLVISEGSRQLWLLGDGHIGEGLDALPVAVHHHDALRETQRHRALWSLLYIPGACYGLAVVRGGPGMEDVFGGGARAHLGEVAAVLHLIRFK